MLGAAAAPAVAAAYLDPGAAYMGLQWVIGAIAGAGAGLVLYRDRLAAAWRRWRKRAPKDAREGGHDTSGAAPAGSRKEKGRGR